MDACDLRGVRTHNLKGIDLSIPFGRMTVITGVSGSGKSSLAFDTIYAEGQRRFVDCLATYARQFLERLDRPDADYIGRLEPPLALKQTTAIRNARSTVGTMSEVSDYLQLLFAHAGEPHCISCGAAIVPETIETAAERLVSASAEAALGVVAQVTRDRLGSAGVRGLLQQGYTRTLDDGMVREWPEDWIDAAAEALPPEVDVVVDRFPAGKARRARAIEALDAAWRLGAGCAHVYELTSERAAILRDRLREGAICRTCGAIGESPSRSLFSANSPIGACPECQGFGRTVVIDPDKVVPDPRRTLRNDAVLPFRMPSRRALYRRMLRLAPDANVRTETPWSELSDRERQWVFEGGKRFPGVQGLFRHLEKKRYKMHIRIFLARFRGYVACAACGGTRLRPAALSVRIDGMNLADLSGMPIAELRTFFDSLQLPSSREARVKAVLREIRGRLRCLDDVGLGYLTLARTARTLSGGETQRLRLAAGMGASLTRTLYVLDEPTVGLHARDAARVLAVLKRICRAGNTAIVVEHDPVVIGGADHLVVLGPEGGERGGELLFEGPPGDFMRGNPGYFRIPRPTPGPGPDPVTGLALRGLSANNLRIDELTIPLTGLVAVSGVSGSGKSTLLDEVIYRNARRFRGLPVEEVGAARSIDGLERLDDVLLIGQDPLGRSTRSNAVSFVKVLPIIRDLFARTPAAMARELTARAFSFNVPGGRCEICKGIGTVVLEMHFLPDVEVTCEACKGRRFRPDVLEVTYRGLAITHVLDLTADEAAEFFADHGEVTRRLKPLQEVGLGYLRLGQSTSTLSGGEAQRLKLASFLAEGAGCGGRRLFLFDEPTTGLHARDVERLLGALRALLRRGNAVIVVEHHLDFLAHADWVIDLGPGAGSDGGQVVYEGPVDGLLRDRASVTGRALSAHLRTGDRAPGHGASQAIDRPARNRRRVR